MATLHAPTSRFRLRAFDRRRSSSSVARRDARARRARRARGRRLGAALRSPGLRVASDDGRDRRCAGETWFDSRDAALTSDRSGVRSAYVLPGLRALPPPHRRARTSASAAGHESTTWSAAATAAHRGTGRRRTRHELSGGERQRVALARALAREPASPAARRAARPRSIAHTRRRRPRRAARHLLRELHLPALRRHARLRGRGRARRPGRRARGRARLRQLGASRGSCLA